MEMRTGVEELIPAPLATRSLPWFEADTVAATAPMVGDGGDASESLMAVAVLERAANPMEGGL